MYACANVSFLFKEVGPLITRFRAAADAGFQYAECDFPTGYQPEEFAQALQSSKLKHVLINIFQGNNEEMGFAATPGSQETFKESLETTLKYTRATNCQKIHILSGCDQGPEKKLDQINTLVENLKWAANVLKEEDVVGVIEPINAYSKPGYFLNSFDTAISVIEAVNSPHIRLQLDFFHLQMIAGNVTNNIKRLLSYAGHVQVAQSPHRHEPSFPGELNMEYVFSELRNAGYAGPVGFEYIPSGPTNDSLNWMKDYDVPFSR